MAIKHEGGLNVLAINKETFLRLPLLDEARRKKSAKRGKRGNR